MTGQTGLVEMTREAATFVDPYFVLYGSPQYSFRYSTTLTMAGKNYYELKEEIVDGFRISTAAEELAIQLALERSGEDPRKSKQFNDFFGRRMPYDRQLTETALRVPKYWKSGSYAKDERGDRFFPRIVLIGDQEVGEVLVPEGGDRRIVVEWNEVFGIPSLTVDEGNRPRYENCTRFYFNTHPKIDERTRRQDVVVWRRSFWPDGGVDACLAVDANVGRSDADSNVGFRLVQGPLHRITKMLFVV